MQRRLFLAAALTAVALPVMAQPARRPRFTIDSAIGDLMDDPKARKVMDKHFPNLRQNGHYFILEDKSVRQLAPISNGKLTPEALARIDAELRAIP